MGPKALPFARAVLVCAFVVLALLPAVAGVCGWGPYGPSVVLVSCVALCVAAAIPRRRPRAYFLYTYTALYIVVAGPRSKGMTEAEARVFLAAFAVVMVIGFVLVKCVPERLRDSPAEG